jgi:hypothetical protein
MKKFILIVFWSILFLPLYLISKKTGLFTNAFIIAAYLLLIFLLISFNHLWSAQTFKSKKGIVKFSVVIIFCFPVLLWLISTTLIAHKAYQSLTATQNDSTQSIEYQADDKLGFRPAPNARSFHRYPIREGILRTREIPQIPVLYDKNGFRIPESSLLKDQTSSKTDLLFLGDSMTFGAACRAEETFPFVVAEELNLSCINAGVSSYGLAQMVLLAEELIPKTRPKYVIVQYSPWLVTRSLHFSAPAHNFFVPAAYFAENDNRISVEKPIYDSRFFFETARKVKSSYRGKFISFLFKEAFPLSLRQMRLFLKTGYLSAFGRIPAPSHNPADAEKFAYNRIKMLAEQNGARFMILNLGDFEYSKNSHQLFSDPNVLFAEADDDLKEFLKTSPSKDYQTEFGHWIINGKNYILIDNHPNPKAHRIIALSIIKAIHKSQ